VVESAHSGIGRNSHDLETDDGRPNKRSVGTPPRFVG
jgi:hypothetical protein